MALEGSYNLWIVGLSWVIACIGAYAGMNVVTSVKSSSSLRAKLAWGASGAIALGCAVWSMHFIGMLAYTLPVPAKMDTLITALSIMPAIIASGIALFVLTYGNILLRDIVLGGILLGAGIGFMHYLGMAAMEGPFILRYDLGIFILSIVIAVLLAIIALYVGLGNIKSDGQMGQQNVLAAGVMGAAISGMHYTGMQAAHFYPVTGSAIPQGMNTDVLVGVIVGFTLFLSALSLASTVINKMFLDLYRATQEAQAAAREKADFLARMSHEIRTPMNAVIGMTRILMKTDPSALQESYLKKITKASGQLLTVINSVLDYSKIEAGKMLVDKTNFNLPQVISNVEELSVSEVSEKDVTLSVHLSEGLPTYVVGDSTKLTQILTNLVSNAVKFTHHGIVNIHASPSENIDGQMVLQFSVSDTGVGLTETQMRGLFQPFTQADGGVTRQFGGTGLGLAICKELCDLMGGRIWVESKIGEGSTFHFTIRVEEGDENIIDSETRESLRNLHVLLLDDSPADIASIMEILKQYEISAKYVSNGRDAITLLEQSDEAPYDFLLADWRLPGEDGIEIALEIEHNPRIRHKPKSIIISAYAKDEVRVFKKSLGLSDYLSKPIVPSLLIDALLSSLQERSEDNAETVSFEEKTKAGYFPGALALLVEDNEFNQEVAIDALQELGLIVELAENGLEAISKLETNSYDVILMDIQMPVMDGLTATAEIRQRWPERSTPVIAMTAHALPGEREKSLQAGMSAHMTKPFELVDLRKVLGKFLVVSDTPNAPEPGNTNRAHDSSYMISQDLIFSRCDNDIVRVRKMLDAFRSSFEGTGSIDAMLGSQDIASIKAVMHSIISPADYLGAQMLLECARSVEDAIRTSNPGQLATQIALFDELLGKVLLEVSALQAQVKNDNGRQHVNTSEGIANVFLKLDELEALLLKDDFGSEGLVTELVNELGKASETDVLRLLQQKMSVTDYDGALALLPEIRLHLSSLH